jgi:serine/threonine protein phosphatase PrpC
VPRVKSITWNAWGDTHPGKLRENNEDRIHCDPDRGIFVVVDGMGGEAAGEEAAQRALDCIRRRLQQETGTVPRRVREAIANANNEVYRLSQSNPAWRGMACVLTLGVLEDGVLHIGHVGDTRLYSIRRGAIRKMTPDHSPVGRREDAGELSEIEAMRHPRRNEVFRDVGSAPHRPDDEDFIDYISMPFEPDSAVVLCSDGLSDMLTSAEIMKTVQRSAGNPRESVRELIRLANAAGGKDNVSAIVVEGDDFARTAYSAPEDSVSSPVPDRTPRRKGWTRGLLGALTTRWYMFVYGLVAGVVLFSYLEPRFMPLSPPEEVSSPAAQQARTFLVDPSGTELTTIAQALEKAGPGDRIELAPGEYRERLRMTDGVRIHARSAGTAVVRPPLPSNGDTAAVIADGIHGAELRGVVIRAGPEPAVAVGIRIVNSDLRVYDVEVSGATRAAVWIDGESNALLIGNYLHSNPGSGVVAAGFSKPRLLGNVIQQNGDSRPKPVPAVVIMENSEPEVLRNVISGNAGEGIRVRQARMKQSVLANHFSVGGGKPNKGGSVTVEKAGTR